MNREEKILMAIDKGYTCNPITGEVFGVFGGVIKAKHLGYNVIQIHLNKKRYNLLAHQFIWYIAHGEIVEQIDHINNIRNDNRISNLRRVSHQQNNFNRTKTKGYYWDEIRNKYKAKIVLNNKSTHLGYFDVEEDAREAYLEAKKIYHII